MPGHDRLADFLCIMGGGLWLISFGSILSNPSALGTIGIVGMTGAAILLAVAAAPRFVEAVRSRSSRFIGLAALIITAATTVFALVLLVVLGDVDEAWGVIDQEWLMWWGYTAFMGVMAVVSVAASRTASSRIELLGWAAAVLAAVGQPVLYVLYVYRPFDYRGMQTVTDLTPLPIALFGAGWILVGIGRLLSGGASPSAPGFHLRGRLFGW